MGAWEGPDDQPGPDESLAVLNALVPATEELDLLDQHRQQVSRAELEETYRQDAARLDAGTYATSPETADEEPGDPAPSAEAEPGPSLTFGQAIGFLHEALGAEVVDDGPGSATPTR